MHILKKALAIAGASLGAALLAVPAAAMPLHTAYLAYTGDINLIFSEGLSVVGDVDAQYRTPPGVPMPYQFSTSLGLGAVSITPVLTVTTPEIVLVPGGTVCLPFIGCVTTPDVTLPSQIIPLSPTIALTDPITVYDYSYISEDLPLGSIFTFDFGTPILGEALTLDQIVQAQFETGAATVTETGSIGPFTGSYFYEGVLQPGGVQILGNYLLDITGPGLLAELESSLLEIINANTGLLAQLALEALLATDPCASLPVGQEICEDALAGLNPDDLIVTVDSIGNFDSSFSLVKSVTPVPTPATLPLLALGVALIGLTTRRRRAES